MLEDIREKKTNRITYLLVIIAGIGMLFIGVPYFNHGGETNIATVNRRPATKPRPQRNRTQTAHRARPDRTQPV